MFFTLEDELAGGNRQLRRGGRSSEDSLAPDNQLPGGNAGRRRLHGGWPNSGEAAVVEGDDLLGRFPPARKPLTGGGCMEGGRTPAKPSWSEVIVFRDLLLRREDHYPEEIGTSEALKKWKYNLLV